MNFQFIEINKWPVTSKWDEITLKMFYNWVQDLYDEDNMMDLEVPVWSGRLPTAKEAQAELEYLKKLGKNIHY